MTRALVSLAVFFSLSGASADGEQNVSKIRQQTAQLTNDTQNLINEFYSSTASIVVSFPDLPDEKIIERFRAGKTEHEKIVAATYLVMAAGRLKASAILNKSAPAEHRVATKTASPQQTKAMADAKYFLDQYQTHLRSMNASLSPEHIKLITQDDPSPVAPSILTIPLGHQAVCTAEEFESLLQESGPHEEFVAQRVGDIMIWNSSRNIRYEPAYRARYWKLLQSMNDERAKKVRTYLESVNAMERGKEFADLTKGLPTLDQYENRLKKSYLGSAVKEPPVQHAEKMGRASPGCLGSINFQVFNIVDAATERRRVKYLVERIQAFHRENKRVPTEAEMASFDEPDVYFRRLRDKANHPFVVKFENGNIIVSGHSDRKRNSSIVEISRTHRF